MQVPQAVLNRLPYLNSNPSLLLSMPPPYGEAAYAATKAAKMTFYALVLCCIISSIISISTLVSSSKNKKNKSLKTTGIVFLVFTIVIGLLALLEHHYAVPSVAIKAAFRHAGFSV
jgi:uncharacterized membrane protein HdeD (DUF308 family)